MCPATLCTSVTTSTEAGNGKRSKQLTADTVLQERIDPQPYDFFQLSTKNIQSNANSFDYP